MSMWHHFTEAADALTDPRLMFPIPFADELAIAIEKWPKFYIPEVGDLSSGRPIENIKPMLRLPYPGLVTLRETKLREADGIGSRGKVLTMFFDLDEVAFYGQKLLDPGDIGKPSWGCFSMTWAPSIGFCPCPPTIFFLDGSREGLTTIIPDTPEVKGVLESGGFTMQQMMSESSDETLALIETCMLLNCNNVETVAVPAPKFVNKKRVSKGKRPLYEYHVLKVDGEVWDSPAATTRDGSGVRSHFRRGHFRRLDASRMTWVRATMVKGSVPGFVDKDYDIKPRALA